MVGDITAIMSVFNQAFIVPFGSTALAGLVLTVVAIIAIGKFGIGIEGAVLIGGGFLLLFSWALFPIDLTFIIVMVLMALFGMAVLMLWRR